MKKLIKGILRLFPIIVVIAVVVTYFMFPNWYKKQGHKIIGVYYVYQGDKAYERSRQKNAHVSVELSSAVKNYNLGLKHYPEHYQARCNLANIYVTFEDYTSAVEQYTKALEYNPDYIECRMNLGILQAEDFMNYDEAIYQYRKVTQTEIPKWKQLKIPYVYNNKDSIKENKMNAHYNTGLAYRGKTIFVPKERLKYNQYLKDAVKAYEKADEAYKKDFKLNKKISNYETLYNLALTHHLLGEKKEAGLNYCRAIEADPRQYDAHLNLAILLDGMKYYDEAIDEFIKAGLLIHDGDYETVLYVNTLLNDSYRKNAILEEQRLMYQQDAYEEEQQEKENWFTKLFKPKQDKSEETKNGSIDKAGQNVIFKKGKAIIKEESEASFNNRIKKCKVKKIFEEMP